MLITFISYNFANIKESFTVLFFLIFTMMKKILILLVVLFAFQGYALAPAQKDIYVIELSDMSMLCTNWEIMKPQDRVFLYHWFLDQKKPEAWLPDIYNNHSRVIIAR